MSKKSAAGNGNSARERLISRSLFGDEAGGRDPNRRYHKQNNTQAPDRLGADVKAMGSLPRALAKPPAILGRAISRKLFEDPMKLWITAKSGFERRSHKSSLKAAIVESKKPFQALLVAKVRKRQADLLGKQGAQP